MPPLPYKPSKQTNTSRAQEAKALQTNGKTVAFASDTAMPQAAAEDPVASTSCPEGSEAAAPLPAASTSAESAIALLQERLLDSRSAAALEVPLRPALQKLHDSMCVTMRAADESNNASFLIIGDHGAGKTLLVERVLSTLGATRTLSAGGDKQLAVVRLSGLVHSEERSAFQEIARQLCSESRAKFSAVASYDENLAFLKDMLNVLHRALMTVVFVLDEFEHFTQSHKQLLLYNLMDALTQSGVQAVVIGVTSCFDVLESLEKRVRSRFSHTKLIVPLPNVFRQGPDCVVGLLEQMLQLPARFPDAPFAVRHNAVLHELLQSKATEAALLPLYTKGLKPQGLTALALGVLLQWDMSRHMAPPPAAAPATAAAAAARAAAARKGKAAATTGAQPAGGGGGGAGAVELAQCHLDAAARQLKAEDQVDVCRITDLTVLQLFLLVALLRLQNKGKPAATFKMVYDEYRNITVPKEHHNFSEPAALGAFQLLLDTGLACYVDRRAEAKGRLLEYVGVQLCVGEADVRFGVEALATCPRLLKQFLKGEV